ncbi:MAG: hypothetical protein FJ220_05535 [Kiritimatiellaceae bacterium]|nr:hypothetical protein [Kiritimatiellaceae bacterium]
MTGSGLEYIHIQRRDDASLIYLVELRTNLLTGGWIAAGYTVLGTNSYNADYDQVRYGLVTTNEASYIRLYIQQQ